MRYITFLLLTLILSQTDLFGQDAGTGSSGTVSYITSQNIYVNFKSTENIAEGDTLFTRKGDTLVPVLIVKAVSSISCVCLPVSTIQLSVSDQVVSRPKIKKPPQIRQTETVQIVPPPVQKPDSGGAAKPEEKKRIQIISGRVSVSSYLNFSSEASNTQRMRYTFSMEALNIGSSKLSAETYMSFVHKLGEWSEIQQDVFNGLKVYSLALRYDFNKSNKIWLGRKINPRISNMGAIDGLQYELKIRSFTIGAVGGFRPDYKNYSFNADLVQFGAYLGHDYSNKNGSMQTTLAFVDQLNKGNTDRRFAYLQHTNSLVRNLYFFGSAEVGLYKKVMNPVDSVQKDTTYSKDNSPTLSNLYLSLRYRPIRQLSLSISYSALQNIIYYESYPKNFLERMLEIATVRGFMFQASYQPVKYLLVNINAGYRDSKNDPAATKNFYGYLTYSRIPAINVGATASVTLLETGYLSANIYSLTLSRDLAKGKLYLDLGYKYVSYNFTYEAPKLIQNMADLNITWRILKKLSFSVYYEGTFEKSNLFNRVYINLTQRF